jgi:hypothetical protein
MEGERRMRMEDEVAFAWIAAHKTADTIVLAWKDTTTFLYTGAPASHGLFIALTPQTPQIKAFASSFDGLPRAYTRGLLLLLKSDLGDGFTGGRLDSFDEAARAVTGARLDFTSSGARVYSFPIPRGN